MDFGREIEFVPVVLLKKEADATRRITEPASEFDGIVVRLVNDAVSNHHRIPTVTVRLRRMLGIGRQETVHFALGSRIEAFGKGFRGREMATSDAVFILGVRIRFYELHVGNAVESVIGAIFFEFGIRFARYPRIHSAFVSFCYGVKQKRLGFFCPFRQIADFRNRTNDIWDRGNGRHRVVKLRTSGLYGKRRRMGIRICTIGKNRKASIRGS